jgi:hypothetical protein
MTLLQLTEVFFLLETVALLIPNINKAILQYTGKVWYRNKTTDIFMNKLFWLFAFAWTVTYIMRLIELVKYGGV